VKAETAYGEIGEGLTLSWWTRVGQVLQGGWPKKAGKKGSDRVLAKKTSDVRKIQKTWYCARGRRDARNRWRGQHIGRETAFRGQIGVQHFEGDYDWG